MIAFLASAQEYPDTTPEFEEFFDWKNVTYEGDLWRLGDNVTSSAGWLCVEKSVNFVWLPGLLFVCLIGM